MRLVEYVISDGEGTLIDHGYVELETGNEILEIFNEAAKGSSVTFEEVDPDDVEFHSLN